MNKLLFPLFLLSGFVFRLWLIWLFPQPFFFDQEQYGWFAKGILESGLYVDSFRTYGYPLFIALVYRLFGADIVFVYLFQAFMDTAVALLIFLIGKKIFSSVKPAFIAFLLYLINPFTASFVGVALSEILTVFLVASIYFLYLQLLETKKLRLGLLLAFLLGYLPQVRTVFILFSLFFLAVLFVTVMRQKAAIKLKIISGIILLFLYFLPFSYNLFGNYKTYRVFTPFSVDNDYVLQAYISLYVDRLPFRQTSIWDYPKEVIHIYDEYNSPKNSQEERTAMAEKYWKLGIEEIKRNPGKFLLWRIQKLFYVWEKHFLFWYVGPNDKIFNFFIYWSNLVIIILGIAGMYLWYKILKEKKYLPFFLMTIFLIVYISLAHIFSTAESRYSLPGYPLIFLFAGFTIWRLKFTKKRLL